MDSIGGAMGFGYACQKCGTPLANAIAEMEHRCLPFGAPAVPPTPTSVEEARQKAYVYDGQSDNVEEVDALIAAVRSSMLREVREMVENAQVWMPNVDGRSMVTVEHRAEHGEWLDRADVLASVRALSSEGK